MIDWHLVFIYIIYEYVYTWMMNIILVHFENLTNVFLCVLFSRSMSCVRSRATLDTSIDCETYKMCF